MSEYTQNLVEQAKEASYKLLNLTTKQKNKALAAMSKALLKNKKFILEENEKDVAIAQKEALSESLIDRLKLNDKRLKEMSVSLKEIAKLPDPIGAVLLKKARPNGIKIQKVRVPIGVILIVYEARPNVTSDCAGLLFKTSNVGILRGGGSALHSNKAIGDVLRNALTRSNIDFFPFFIVDNPQRHIVDELLEQDKYIDLVIPRGGESLIRKVVETSHIPVIKHYKGVCHIFVDKYADIKKALKICINAKVQRPSVCNAVETILIHEDRARKFLPLLAKQFNAFSVIMRGDEKTCEILPYIQAADSGDWAKEYLDLTVSVKVVKTIDEAIRHINTYGSGHTESILTKNKANADKFVKEVDSACCFVNISTRFSDGYQFGLGAEIGISTDKLHARGPMGLEELTTYKWLAYGDGQIRK